MTDPNGAVGDKRTESEDEEHDGIWLEVTEVRYDSEKKGMCSLLLKGDREHPKPVWWPVEDKALQDKPFETYKEILREMDKKRLVLARLSRDRKNHNRLCCDAFRFQSPDLGSR